MQTIIQLGRSELQETIRRLTPEQLSNVETILKTIIPQPEIITGDPIKEQ